MVHRLCCLIGWHWPQVFSVEKGVTVCGTCDHVLQVFPRPQRLHLRLHDRVRLVSMDGCMAHIRNILHEGTVIGFRDLHAYGDTQVRGYVNIRLDGNDGTTLRPMDRHLWTQHEDGIWEYHV